MLHLQKPLVFFDLETTGTQVSSDRIVEIALLKIHKDQKEEAMRFLVNPEKPIPKEASEVHGIYDKDVKNEKPFSELADLILKFIGDADLAGYNSNRFDIPLLVEEFNRVGKNFDVENKRFVDVQVIYHKNEPRNLEAAYKFYCHKKLEDAHTAMADTRATYEILKSQIQKYDTLENSVEKLSDFSNNLKTLDLGGRIALGEDQKPVFNFGKYKSKSVFSVFEKEPQYYSWIMRSDFHSHTKTILKKLWKEFKEKIHLTN